MLLTDPFTFPAEGVLDRLRAKAPGLQVVGGMASAAQSPGGNRLVLDDAIHVDGAVGVLLDPAVVSGTVVSQGCRPVGQAVRRHPGHRERDPRPGRAPRASTGCARSSPPSRRTTASWSSTGSTWAR